MADELNQVADTTMSDEELELELDLGETEDVATLKEELEKKNKIIRQVLARAKKAETKIKAEPPVVTNQEQSKDFFEDERFDLFQEGHSKDTIKFIIANGGRKALEDPNSLVSIAVRAQQEQRKAEQAASHTADTSGMSELERKYTPEMLKNMSVAELEKIVPRA